MKRGLQGPILVIDQGFPADAGNTSVEENFRVNWLGRLLAWDGVLPVVVCATPTLVNIFVPDSEMICLTLSIILPIAALLIRFYVGYAMIATNGCSPSFRKVQVVCLCVGLFILMCLDSLLMVILSLNLPGNPDGEPVVVAVIFVIFYVPYLAFLAVAMYPGSNHNGILTEVP